MKNLVKENKSATMSKLLSTIKSNPNPSSAFEKACALLVEMDASGYDINAVKGILDREKNKQAKGGVI